MSALEVARLVLQHPAMMIRASLVVSALALAFASPAMAGQINVGANYGLYQSGVGGEFTLNVVGDWLSLDAYDDDARGAAWFQSFCLEMNEYLNTNTTYNASLSDGAVSGGVSGGNPDKISAGTAYLYSQFASGALAGYIYDDTTERKKSAAALQQAIWWLEGELGANEPAPSNLFLSLLTSGEEPLFGSLDAARLDAEGRYGVWVVNITTSGGTLGQSQLYFAGEDVKSVPDGGTATTLLGLGLVGLAAGRRYLA